MYFPHKKSTKIRGQANSAQSSFQTFIFSFIKVLTLLSILGFVKSLDYKPNHWSYRNVSQYSESLKNSLLHKHNKYYIGVLQQSQLTIFHKSNLTVKDVYKMNPNDTTGDSILFKSDEQFRDFDFVLDQHVVAIASIRRFFVVDLITEQYQVDLQNKEWVLCSIQITKSAIYVLGIRKYFGRYKRKSLQNSQGEYEEDDFIKYQNMRLQDACMKMQVSEYIPPTVAQQPYVHGLAQQNADIQYIIFHKSNYTSIYSCSKTNFQGNADCIFINLELSYKYGAKVEKASFSADCTKTILEFDDKSPLLVIDLAGNRTLTQIEQDSDVLISEFYNYQATVVMVWNSKMNITLYEVRTGLLLAFYNQGTDRNITFVNVDLQQEMLIMITDKFIYQYNFDCNSQILYYYAVGKCKTCSERCPLGQYCHNQSASCIQHILINQTTHQHQQFQAEGETALYKQAKATIEAFSQGLQIVGGLATYTIWTFTAIPVASFFLGFINFWTICSFYVLLDIHMPQFLRTSLTNLFIALNSSMINSVGIKFSPKLFLSEDSQNQKIRNDFAVDFHLSLDFLLMNSENLLTCTFSVLLCFIIWICFFKNENRKMQFQNSNSKIQHLNKTKIEYTLNPIFIGFGQVISICPLFFLGLMFMKGKSGYSNFNQKLNLICFEISIGILLCVSPFVITFIKLDKKYIKPVQKKAQTLQQKKFNIINLKRRQSYEALVLYKRLKWVYILQCNITLPYFVILGYVKVCLSVNYLIFGYGIFICYKDPNVSFFRRINNVAMALEIFIVNLAMSLIVVIDYLGKQNYHYLIHIIGIFCLGTILLGALHQIMNLIIVDIVINFIVKNCKKYFFKSKILSTEKDNKQQLKQNQKGENSLKNNQENIIFDIKKYLNRNFMKYPKRMKFRQQLNLQNKKLDFKQQTIQEINRFKTIIPLKKFRLFKSKYIHKTDILTIFDTKNSQENHQDLDEHVYQKKRKFQEICSEQNTVSKVRGKKNILPIKQERINKKIEAIYEIDEVIQKNF